MQPDAVKDAAKDAAKEADKGDASKACSPKAGSSNSAKYDHNVPGDVRASAMCNGMLEKYYAACNAGDAAGASKALTELDQGKDPAAAKNGSDGTCILLRSAAINTPNPISQGGGSVAGTDAAQDFIGPRTPAQIAAEAKLNTANFGGADEVAAVTEDAKPNSDFIGPRTPAQIEAETTQAQAAATLQDSNALLGNETLGSRLTATQLLEEGKWPTTLKERQALMAQYLKEKGLPDEVTKAMLMTAYKENRGMDPKLCTSLGTSACGMFQYTKGTWSDNGGTADNRYDPKSQIDVAANNFMERYEQYQAGTLKCGSGQTSYYNCNAVYHQAGSFTPKAYAEGWVQGAIATTNNTLADATRYANQALSMVGIDVSKLTVEQQTGLGASVAQTLGYGNNGSNGYAGDFSVGNTNNGSIANMLSGYMSNQPYIPGLTNNKNIVELFTNELISKLFGKTTTASNNDDGGGSYTGDTPTYTGTGSVRGYELAKACGGSLPSSADAVMLMIQACQSVKAAG